MKHHSNLPMCPWSSMLLQARQMVERATIPGITPAKELAASVSTKPLQGAARCLQVKRCSCPVLRAPQTGVAITIQPLRVRDSACLSS